MSNTSDELPMASHGGILKIGNTKINCFVVPQGEDKAPLRLLTGRAVTNALGFTGRGQGMTRFLVSKSLRPYIGTDIIEAIQNPIRFRSSSGGLPAALGYHADMLPKLCYAIMDAHDAAMIAAVSKGTGKDRPQTTNQADGAYIQAKMLARGFSVVGINALVDEATGYQDVRDRLALQKILDAYLAEEWRKGWTCMFPIEFYKEIFKLRGWKWSDLSSRRPGVVGYLTNDIVYSRLHPDILEELKKNVPRNEQGKPKSKLFMGLSEDVGVPALKEHLDKVILLMEVSLTWPSFYTLLNRKFPLLRKPTRMRPTSVKRVAAARYQQMNLLDED